MAKPADIRALRNLVTEAESLLATTLLPEGRATRALELLRAAIPLIDAVGGTERAKPAAVLGAKGGKVTAKRGPGYFAKIAAMRKTRAGGRPKKSG